MIQNIGKYLVLFGVILTICGVVLLLAGKFSFSAKLPGDIIVRRENFTFYFPFTTCLLISLFISIGIYLLSRR